MINVDDTKIIDWILSKIIFQSESNKHRTKIGNKKHNAQGREPKINNIC